MGLAYSTIGESVLAAESAARAWQLRDRVSDRERFFIDFTYDRQVTGNLEKAYQTLELWLQAYPRGEAPTALSLLGGLSTHGTGRFERAIETSLKQIALEPDYGIGYGSLAQSYFFLGRFDEAERVIQRATERNIENPILLLVRYNIAVLKGDQGQLDRIAALAKGKPTAATRWLTPRLSLWLVPAGCNWPGSHPAAPWIWPCRNGNAKLLRVTRPHERCGRPCAGMLPKRVRTPSRHWSSQMAGMSNTPPALPWLFRETPLDRNRLPTIWNGASRKIRSPNLLTYRFFAHYPH